MSGVHICPLCGATSSVERHAEPFPVRECACGLAFLWPQPSEKELQELYSEEYYKSWGVAGENDELPRQMKHLTFASRLHDIETLIPSPGKVLDVGCATGYFLEVAQSFGWEVAGVELSAYSAGLAAAKFGKQIFNGTLEQAAYPAATFDLVTLSDLIEHVPDPLAFLNEVRRILKPGGLVVIVTPDLQSLTERVMRGKWSHYKLEHIYYYSQATINSCLEKSGFTPVKIKPAPKYLNLAYIINQFAIYPHPLLTPLARILDQLVPQRLKQHNIPVLCGEMMVIARSPSVDGVGSVND